MQLTPHKRSAVWGEKNEHKRSAVWGRKNEHKHSAVWGVSRRHSAVWGVALLLLAMCSLSAQPVTGYWEGKIAVSKHDSLTIGVQIENRADTLYIELDSPDQYFIGQPASDPRFADSTLSFHVPKFNLSYEGRISADGQRFTGVCAQHGRKFACTLAKGATRKCFPRPQTPAPPYPYQTKELNFRDRSGKKPLIAGTLTLPADKPQGLVVLISGSGWQDRDETLFAHKPFAVLADTLTKAGFATFRYDDFPVATFLKSTTYDFADAVQLILDSLLQRNDLQGIKLGLLGHSEGSLVAAMVAADDPRVGFTIHLGGVAQPFDEILLFQSEALNRASNTLTEKEIANSTAINRKMYERIKKSKNRNECAEQIGKLWDELAAQLTEEERAKYRMTPDMKLATIQTMSSPWYYELFKIEPGKYWKKIASPVLAISGAKDLQVEAKAAFGNMQKYLKKKTIQEYHLLPDDNHLLQPCKTGSTDEYATIETTIDPAVLGILIRWVKSLK